MTFQTQQIEKKIGYTFKDKGLLRQAFTRSSYENEHPGKCKSNEVLEFFGDTVLSCAIVSYFIDHMTTRSDVGIVTKFEEGGFSNIKSKLSDKKNLSRSMKKLGIAEHLIMGAGDRHLGISDEPSVMEDLFESIIGAVYVDSGKDMNAVAGVVSKMLDVGDFLSGDVAVIQSNKNALQEFCAFKKHRLPSPEYAVIGEVGPDHEKVYSVRCTVGEIASQTGDGKNQKAAENVAAGLLLEVLLKMEEAGTLPATKSTPDDNVNYVGKLLTDAQKRGETPPVFSEPSPTKDATELLPKFSCSCRYRGLFEVGFGVNKKTAKREAAKAIFCKLGL